MILRTHIQELGNDNPLVKELLNYLEKKKRFTADLTVDQALKVVSGTRSEVIGLFKKLEEAGLGDFIAGRKGNKSRFQWKVHASEIVKAWTGEIEAIDDSDGTGTDADADELDMVEHKYRLRQDLEIVLELPDDLTHREASRLAKWLETLPFEED